MQAEEPIPLGGEGVSGKYGGGGFWSMSQSATKQAKSASEPERVFFGRVDFGSDSCGVRTHALSEWRLEPPP